jgi:cobalt/nickel transport system permease protein
MQIFALYLGHIILLLFSQGVFMFSSLPLSSQPMHIPDGFLSTVISVVFWVLAIGFIVVALRNVRSELGDRQIPLMGVLAAAIFAGQMLNFSISGGTSGHC